MDELPEHVAVNREYWDGMAHEWVEGGEGAWNSTEPTWGVWAIPESELRLLPDDMSGMHAIELGCGTAYVSGWMARRGASVTGIDNSVEQLRTAHRLSEQHGVAIEFIHGNAEAVPMSMMVVVLVVVEEHANGCHAFGYPRGYQVGCHHRSEEFEDVQSSEVCCLRQGDLGGLRSACGGRSAGRRRRPALRGA